MSQRKNGHLRRVLEWGLTLTLLLPLAVVANPFSDTSYTTFFTQGMLFQLLVEGLVIAWLFAMAKDNALRPPWRHPIVLTATMFLFATAFTQLFSIWPERSFWSTQDRMTGVFHNLHVWAYLLVLVSTVDTQAMWERLVRWSVSVSGIVSALAMIQWLALDGGRITSTLSNPNNLALYALLHIFLALWLHARTKKRWPLAIGALHILTIFIAGSQGGLVALSVGGITWAAHRWIQKPLTKTVAITLLGAALLGALLTFANAGILAQHLNQETRGTLVHSVTERLELWNIGWQAFTQHPVVGWGYETFTVPFDQLRDARVQTNMTERWADRAHNQWLDALVSTGLIGFTALIALWGAALWSSREDRALFCALVAIPIFQSVQFDTLYSTIFLTFIFGLIAYQSRHTSTKNTDAHGTTLLWLPVVASVILLPIASYANINSLTLNMQKTAAVQALNTDLVVALEKTAATLANPSPYRYNMRRQIAAEVFEHPSGILKMNTDESHALIALLADQIHDENQKDPAELRLLLASFWLHSSLATSDADAAERARQSVLLMQDIAPTRPETYASLAIQHVVDGNIMEAIDAYEMATALAFDQSSETSYRIEQANLYAGLGAWENMLTSLEGIDTIATTQLARIVLSAASAVSQDNPPPDLFLSYVVMTANNSADNHSVLEAAITILETGGRMEDANMIRNYLEGR